MRHAGRHEDHVAFRDVPRDAALNLPIDDRAARHQRSRSFDDVVIVAGTFTDWWIYLVAPIVGAGIAATLYILILRPDDAP